MKKYSVIIYTILLFLLSVTIVVYIFPKDKKFKYAFTEGSPWLYEDLVAHIDFPIYKTKQELDMETDSVYSSFIPYYIVDTSVEPMVMANIERGFQQVDNSRLKDYFDNNLSHELSFAYRSYYFGLKKSVDSLISKVYQKGLIEVPDSITNYYDYKFFVIKDDIYELSFINEFYTKYDIAKLLLKIYDNSKLRNIDSLNSYPVLNLLRSDFFIPNVVFDVNVSARVLEKQIESISPSRGIVQNGELIIRKGSIVGEKENKILLSLKREEEADSSDINRYWISVGVILLFLSLYMIVYLCYFYFYNKNALLSSKNNTFFTLQMLLTIFLVFVVFKYTELSINIIPFTLVAALLMTFYRFNISFFVYLLTVFVAGFFAPNRFEFVFIQVITGMVAMYSLRKKQRRQQIFVTLLLVFLSYMVLYIGFVLMRQGSFSEFVSRELYAYVISSVAIVLYLPIVYIYEKVFGFISDFTLMEISDTNNSILRELAEKAPGTFQHSIQVANIVESVVRELGGDSLLARVGALYHDIGKLEAPELFIENQHGVNVHDNFDYEESAQKIIAHVKGGIEIAKKHRLPKQIIDFISMHHGTSVTRYFYISWINKNQGLTPNLSNFKYPGPKPQSMETAILMMADSIEAASRTLKEYTPESIEKLVNGIVSHQLEDGQFDEVEITLKQINTAKSIFVSKIENIYHTRIAYPEVEVKEKND